MLVLPAEVTHRQARACLQMLRQALGTQTGNRVELDASPLKKFDSSALAVLLEFRRDCQAQNKALDLLGLSGQLLDLAVLYGVSELLPQAVAKA
ncbi:MAG: STAS domain-containing protein [Hylemonella sp.]